jgi:dTDP-4-dehydrorhamnose 3,5-epimerase-like enzyme
MYKEVKNYPWVFWVRVEKRDWFAKFYKSRESNALDLQFFNWHISLGRPWHQEVLKKAEVIFPMDGLDHCRKVNETFTKWYHFKIGDYNKVKILQ